VIHCIYKSQVQSITLVLEIPFLLDIVNGWNPEKEYLNNLKELVDPSEFLLVPSSDCKIPTSEGDLMTRLNRELRFTEDIAMIDR
jgi:hypothetical protein